MPGAHIVPYPQYRATSRDVVVRVDVTSFEAHAPRNARLDASWTFADRVRAQCARNECASIAEAVDASLGGVEFPAPEIPALAIG